MNDSLDVNLRGVVEVLLRAAPRKKKPKLQAVLTTCHRGFLAHVTFGKDTKMAYTLAADHLVVVRVDYVDKNGNPAEIDGEVTWDTSAQDVVTVTVDEGDSHMCTIVPATRLGTAQVSAHADADLGEGTRALYTTFDVTTVAGSAVAGTISPVGDPEPIAPHPEQNA